MPNTSATALWNSTRSVSKIENDLTRNILKAILSDKLDYRPHEEVLLDRSNCLDDRSRTLCAGSILPPILLRCNSCPFIQALRKYSSALRG